MTDSEEERVYNYYDPDHDPETQKLYIHWAINDDSLKTVKQLVEDGADVNVLQYFDCTCGNISCDPPMTPLMAAVQIGNTEIVSYLLQAGADPLIINEGECRNALHYACESLSLLNVKLLLENTSLDINLPDDSGATPLLIALSSVNSRFFNNKLWPDLDIIDYLIEHGANIHHKDYYGGDCMHCVAVFGNVDLLQKLITANADVNSVRTLDQASPLIIAAQNTSKEFISALLRSGAKVDAVNHKGNTALHEAIKMKNIEAVKPLLEAKADLNVRNNDGKTPLMLAVNNKGTDLYYTEKEQMKVVSYLLEAGADINIKDVDGKTALDLCETEDIKNLLINRCLESMKIS